MSPVTPAGLLRPVLYAIRCMTPKSQAYLVRDLSGTPVSNEVMLEGYRLRPITVAMEDAIAMLDQYRATLKTPEPWALEVAPNGCPCCGRTIWANDENFCYSVNPGKSLWRAGCNADEFGCGHEVWGASREEALSAWNSFTKS